MYQALYRKWRPRTFSDVVGQNHVTVTLKRQVAEGRTSHAYLFTGTRGTGKTTCAKILARAVNCLDPREGDPCGRCPACRSLESGSCLDVLELDAASNNGVDQVRALRDEAVYAPAGVRLRVYIVDEVHMLSPAAFNALLKILEEPPAHLMFILATTELHKVPATILSRCQRFTFKRILPRQIQERLRHIAGQEGIDLTPDGAELLSRLADGALRDALSLLDQCAAARERVDAAAIQELLGLSGSQETVRLLGQLLRRDAAGALELFGALYDAGKDASAMLGQLLELVRDLLVWAAAAEGGEALLSGEFDGQTLRELEGEASPQRLLVMAAALQQTLSELYDSAHRRTDGELCLLRLCDERLWGDPADMEGRLLRLEELLLRPGAAPPPADRPRPAPPAREEDRPPWDAPAPEEAPPPGDEPLPPEEAPPAAEASAPLPHMAEEGDRWWRILAERCKGRLPPMYRAFLERCAGALEGERLTVYAPDEVTLGRLDNERVRGALTEEGSAAAGRRITLALQVGQGPDRTPEENWQTLLEMGSRFDNIELQ